MTFGDQSELFAQSVPDRIEFGNPDRYHLVVVKPYHQVRRSSVGQLIHRLILFDRHTSDHACFVKQFHSAIHGRFADAGVGEVRDKPLRIEQTFVSENRIEYPCAFRRVLLARRFECASKNRAQRFDDRDRIVGLALIGLELRDRTVIGHAIS